MIYWDEYSLCVDPLLGDGAHVVSVWFGDDIESLKTESLELLLERYLSDAETHDEEKHVRPQVERLKLMLLRVVEKCDAWEGSK